MGGSPSPFTTASISEYGTESHIVEDDRSDVPNDFRFMDLVVKLAGDPELGIGAYAQGVRVGPKVRMPRLPALYLEKQLYDTRTAERTGLGSSP